MIRNWKWKLVLLYVVLQHISAYAVLWARSGQFAW